MENLLDPMALASARNSVFAQAIELCSKRNGARFEPVHKPFE